MAQNYTKEVFNNDTNWVCPAGVTKITLSTYKLYRSSMCGESSKHLLDADGTLYGVGSNTSGKLGDGTSMDTSSPVVVAGALKYKSVHAAKAQNTVKGLTTNDVIYSWGTGALFALGDGTAVDKSSPVAVVGNLPVQNPFNPTTAHHGMGLNSQLQAYSWGYNNSGQLGINSVVNQSTPVPVVTGVRFKRLYAEAQNTSFGIDEEGRLYAWGSNLNGVLGDGTIVSRSTPVLVNSFQRFKHVSSNLGTLAISTNGALYGWGNNSNFLLYGYGTGNYLDPVLIETSINGQKFKKVSVSAGGGNRHVVALMENGDLYTWGLNQWGQCGVGSSAYLLSTPTLVVGGRKWQDAFCAESGTMAIDVDGNYWGWGENFLGSLGSGTSSVSVSTPVLISNSIKYAQPKELIGRYTVDVIPGAMYPVKVGDWYGLFDNKFYGVDVQEMVLEYFG